MLLAGMQIPLQLFGHAFEISEQGLALLCLPLLWCYHGRQGAHNRKIQLACYAFYPVHMLVLGILSKLILVLFPKEKTPDGIIPPGVLYFTLN